MAGHGEISEAYRPLFERFEAIFSNPEFAPGQTPVMRDNRVALRRSGVTSTNVGVLESMRGLRVACYKYYLGYSKDPDALRYETQFTRYGEVITALAFSAVSSFEREGAELQRLDEDAALSGHVAVRYALKHMKPLDR